MSTKRGPELPDAEQTLAASKAIAAALGKQDYAIVGGAACSILGSRRLTSDVDFVVPKGATKSARDLLKQQPTHFDIDRRTQHTNYKSSPPIEVEILTPPALFKQEFSKTTPIIVQQGIRILKPTLILNAKCGSILGRATEDKKRTDAADIKFLLAWCAHHKLLPSNADVPNADSGLVELFIGSFGDGHLWKNAGYDMTKGRWSH
ncbi:hypothetical protein F5Y18DRAFT_391854 [Xylariaceae sp. FL1019]|nr:hypothetical protein F5Y18DRAFT_391854 [Xylariaceae sp. FL1019]